MASYASYMYLKRLWLEQGAWEEITHFHFDFPSTVMLLNGGITGLFLSSPSESHLNGVPVSHCLVKWLQMPFAGWCTTGTTFSTRIIRVLFSSGSSITTISCLRSNGGPMGYSEVALLNRVTGAPKRPSSGSRIERYSVIVRVIAL